MNNTEYKRVPASFIELKCASELDEHIKKAGTREVVLIQFTASWCGRCSVLKKEIAERFDALQFGKCACKLVHQSQYSF